MYLQVLLFEPSKDKPTEFVYLPSYVTFHPESEGDGEAVSIYVCMCVCMSTEVWEWALLVKEWGREGRGGSERCTIREVVSIVGVHCAFLCINTHCAFIGGFLI